MVYLVILGCMVLLPLVTIVLLKAHGSIVFMSLCLGSVLVSYVASDMTDVITSVHSGSSPLLVSQGVKIGLLTTPFLLAILFTRKSVRGGKQLVNIFTALASGLLFALLITPLLSANLQREIQRQALWHQLSSLQTAVIIFGATLSLLFLLTNRPSHKDGKKHSK